MTRLAVPGLALLAACVSSGPRPIPPVAEEVVPAPVSVTRAAVRQGVSNLGLPLRASEVEGQVETAYVDIASYRAESSQYPYRERLVRFVVSARPDQNSAGTQVAVLAIYDPFRTGLTATRRGERAIPRSHPAMDVVRELMEEIRKLAEGG